MARINYERLMEEYEEFIAESCQCDKDEDGCSCEKFEKWLNHYLEELALSSYDDREQYA